MLRYLQRIGSLLVNRPHKLPALARLAVAPWLRRGSASLPQTVAMIPTFRCNLRCKLCGQWGEKGYLTTAAEHFDRYKQEVSTAQWRGVIAELAGFKPFLYFTGGEPLLREDIFELLGYAGSLGMLTSLNSNCIALSGCADDLAKSGLDYLYASLDGPPGCNEEIRLGSPAGQAVEGLLALREARRRTGGLPLIEIRLTLCAANQGRLFETAAYLEQHLRPDAFCISPPIFTSPELAAETAELYKAHFAIEAPCWRGFAQGAALGIDPGTVNAQISMIQKRRWGFKLRLHPPLNMRNFDCADYFRNIGRPLPGHSSCGALYAFPAILPNGDVATCPSVPDYIAGNVTAQSFREVWNGKRYQELRRFTQKRLFPACARCSHLYQFPPPRGQKGSGAKDR